MIKVSVMYPYQAGARFDFTYYCEQHLPLLKKLMGAACVQVSVDKGLAGGAPGTPPSYTAVGHVLSPSVEAFQTAFAPHAATILGDIVNYTDLQPTLQFSEVVIG